MTLKNSASSSPFRSGSLSLLLAGALASGVAIGGGSSGVEGFFEDFEQTGPFAGWGTNTTQGVVGPAPSLPGQIFANTALRAGPEVNNFLASIRFPIVGSEPPPTGARRVLVPSGGPVLVSADIHLSSLDGAGAFETVGPVTLAARTYWGGECVDEEPGYCDSIGVGVGPVTTFHILSPGAPGSSTGIFVEAVYSNGVKKGQPVPVPVGGWFRLTYEFTEDGRTRLYLDEGQGEELIADVQSLPGVGVSTVSLVREDASTTFYLDNVRAVGPSARCAGDADFSGAVDFADLNAVLGSFGTTGSRLAGDTNIDGGVDFLDLNRVLSGFGTCAN